MHHQQPSMTVYTKNFGQLTSRQRDQLTKYCRVDVPKAGVTKQLERTGSYRGQEDSSVRFRVNVRAQI